MRRRLLFLSLVFSLSAIAFLGLAPDASAQNSQKLQLDGDQDYATAPDSPALSFEGSDDQFTVEAWIKHDSTSDDHAYILHKRGSNGYGYSMHFVGSGEEVPIKFVHEGNRARGITSNTGIPADRWTHVAVTYDGSSTMSIYINGKLDNSVNDDKAIWDNSEPLRIGTNRTEDGNFFSGEIDEVRIWNAPRTATEIRENRFSSLSGSETGLIAYYPFDSGSPTADQSGNGHALTLYGNASTETRDVFPVPPDLYVENEGNGQVSLRWEERTGPNGANAASSFTVYQSPPTGLSGRSQSAQVSASSSTYTATSLSNGKTYFWELTATDGSGDESDFSPVMTGTPYNGSEPTPVKGGTALSLDGTDDYGAVSDRPSLSVTGDSITVEAWIKHDSTSAKDAYILHKRGSNGYGYIMRLVGSGEEVPIKFVHEGNRARGITSNSGIPADRWTHVAVVSDASEMRLYINGELDNSVSDEKGLWDNSEPLRFGTNRTTDGNFFSGRIDEVRIWADARSATEIQNQYQHELVGNEPGLRGYFRFNDGRKGVNQGTSTGATERQASVVLSGDATVNGPGVFPLPPRLYAQAGDASVDLSWAERRSGEADQFHIYRATAPDGSDRSSVTTQSASNTSYTDDGASNATNTFHEATAVNAAGQESDYAHPVPTTPSPRFFGNGLALDGTGDYGTVSDRPSLMPTGDSLTVEAWIRYDGTSDADAFILHNRGSDGQGYILRLVGSGDQRSVKFAHKANRAQGITSNTSVEAGQWAHVAVVWDGSETRLYINGTLDNSVNDDKGIWDNSEPLRIGTNRTEDDRFFSGRIDEVRIWDDARTEAEIQQHHRLELHGNEEILRAYFRFNETPGTAVSRGAAQRPQTVELSGDADFAESLSFYPKSLTATVSRSFGQAASSSDYRLVALPGQVSRPLADAVSGEAGVEWQAYHDDGSDSDFLQKFDGSDAFTFEPGRGFWLTATSDWTEDVDVSTVPLRGDSAVVVDVRDGWNVVSNPMGTPVSYDALVSANRAAANGPLQPLWGFDGTFSQADSMHSAAEGVAYYFLNDQGLDSLRIPYPGAASKRNSPQTDRDDSPMLALTATPAGGENRPGSTVRIGLVDNQKQTRSIAAPPGRFETVSLRIAARNAADRPKRRRLLMAEQRALDAESDGITFTLRLRRNAEGPVRLSARGLSSVAPRRHVRLLVPATGQSYDLRNEKTVTVDPTGEEPTLKVAVGAKSYVQQQAEQITPDKVTLTSYPNPVREQGTLEYAVPDQRKVTLRVYDMLGREVATLVDEQKKAGRHRVQLRTDQLSSGVYFGRLEAGSRHLTQKITVVR